MADLLKTHSIRFKSVSPAHKPWEVTELEAIASKGFKALNLWASDDLIRDLAGQSFGSPQIMQQLCLDLCEVENEIFDREDRSPAEELHAPADREAFFRALDDDGAIGWLKKLAAGPKHRKKRKRHLYPTTPPVELDGYQLILHTIHELDSPTRVPLVDLKRHVRKALQLDPKSSAILHSSRRPVTSARLRRAIRQTL